MSLDAIQLSLLSALESNTEPVLPLFSAHLAPFSQLHGSKPPHSSQTLTLARSLAKRFLPFLNRSLSALPKLLRGTSSPRGDSDDLFLVYELCLRCLDSVSSQLSGKLYDIEKQWLGMLFCMESCGRHMRGVKEGTRVLNRLLAMKEDVGRDDREEYGRVVVEVGLIVIRCAAKSLGVEEKGEELFLFRKVLWAVEEIREGFR